MPQSSHSTEKCLTNQRDVCILCAAKLSPRTSMRGENMMSCTIQRNRPLKKAFAQQNKKRKQKKTKIKQSAKKQIGKNPHKNPKPNERKKCREMGAERARHTQINYMEISINFIRFRINNANYSIRMHWFRDGIEHVLCSHSPHSNGRVS